VLGRPRLTLAPYVICLANHAGVALRSNADESKGFYGAFDKVLNFRQP
jgi:hypothetical protein